MTRMHRAVARTAVLLTGTALATLPTLASAPLALAARRDDGEQPGPGLSVLETLGLYVGLPLLVVVVVALLTFAPHGSRGPRYRPGLTWWAEPVWIGGPTDRQAADVRIDEPAGELPAGIPGTGTDTTGGARARW